MDFNFCLDQYNGRCQQVMGAMSQHYQKTKGLVNNVSLPTSTSNEKCQSQGEISSPIDLISMGKLLDNSSNSRPQR